MAACKSTPTELVERRNLERPKAATRKNAEGLKLGQVIDKPSLTLMSSWIFNPGENKRPRNSMGGGEDKDTPWKRMRVEAHAGSTPRAGGKKQLVNSAHQSRPVKDTEQVLRSATLTNYNRQEEHLLAKKLKVDNRKFK